MVYFTPGEVSARTGLSLDTLRYYERMGLFPAIGRTPGGRRRYREIDLRWLGLIRCLRDTDMPIADIRTFTRLVSEPGTENRAERVALLEEHERRIEATIARLTEHLAQIRGKVRHIRASEPWSPDQPPRRSLGDQGLASGSGPATAGRGRSAAAAGSG